MDANERLLIELLMEVGRGNMSSADATAALHERLLAVGSASPDNLSCASHVEIGTGQRVSGRLRTTGIKVKGKDISLVTLLEQLEGAPIPSRVRKRLPTLTQVEWDACFRIMTLILASLEHTVSTRPGFHSE